MYKCSTAVLNGEPLGFPREELFYQGRKFDLQRKNFVLPFAYLQEHFIIGLCMNFLNVKTRYMESKLGQRFVEKIDCHGCFGANISSRRTSQIYMSKNMPA